jgi:hypothetical protein
MVVDIPVLGEGYLAGTWAWTRTLLLLEFGLGFEYGFVNEGRGPRDSLANADVLARKIGKRRGGTERVVVCGLDGAFFAEWEWHVEYRVISKGQ